LTQLPDDIQNLTKLNHLNLSKNALYSLPDAISSLTKLEYLDLRDNPIAKLPESISALKRLKKLMLYRTQVSDQEMARLKSSLSKCTIFY